MRFSRALLLIATLTFCTAAADPPAELRLEEIFGPVGPRGLEFSAKARGLRPRSGNKANNNQHGVFPDDTTDNFDNPRVESIGEFLHRTRGTSLGIVTTADVFDATPGAFGSHTQSRAAHRLRRQRRPHGGLDDQPAAAARQPAAVQRLGAAQHVSEPACGPRPGRLFTGVMDNTDVFFKIMQAALAGSGR